jgi:hypothetical protein
MLPQEVEKSIRKHTKWLSEEVIVLALSEHYRVSLRITRTYLPWIEVKEAVYVICVDSGRTRSSRCSLDRAEKTSAISALSVFAENRIQIEVDDSVNPGIRDKHISTAARTKSGNCAERAIPALHAVNKPSPREHDRLPKEWKISIEFLSNNLEEFGIRTAARFYDSSNRGKGVAYFFKISYQVSAAGTDTAFAQSSEK